PHLDRHLAEPAVEVFAALGHGPRGGVLVHAQPHGVEVEIAAGAYEAVDAFEVLLQVGAFTDGGDEQRESSRGGDGVVIAGVEPAQGVDVLVLAGGAVLAVDSDDGLRIHLRSILSLCTSLCGMKPLPTGIADA